MTPFPIAKNLLSDLVPVFKLMMQSSALCVIPPRICAAGPSSSRLDSKRLHHDSTLYCLIRNVSLKTGPNVLELSYVYEEP